VRRLERGPEKDRLRALAEAEAAASRSPSPANSYSDWNEPSAEARPKVRLTPAHTAAKSIAKPPGYPRSTFVRSVCRLLSRKNAKKAKEKRDQELERARAIQTPVPEPTDDDSECSIDRAANKYVQTKKEVKEEAFHQEVKEEIQGIEASLILIGKQREEIEDTLNEQRDNQEQDDVERRRHKVDREAEGLQRRAKGLARLGVCIPELPEPGKSSHGDSMPGSSSLAQPVDIRGHGSGSGEHGSTALSHSGHDVSEGQASGHTDASRKRKRLRSIPESEGRDGAKDRRKTRDDASESHHTKLERN